MNDVDLAAIQNRYGELRPTDDEYQVLLIDRRLPLSDPDAVTVAYESDDIRGYSFLPECLGLSLVAIQDDGAVIEVA